MSQTDSPEQAALAVGLMSVEATSLVSVIGRPGMAQAQKKLEPCRWPPSSAGFVSWASSWSIQPQRRSVTPEDFADVRKLYFRDPRSPQSCPHSTNLPRRMTKGLYAASCFPDMKEPGSTRVARGRLQSRFQTRNRTRRRMA